MAAGRALGGISRGGHAGPCGEEAGARGGLGGPRAEAVAVGVGFLITAGYFVLKATKVTSYIWMIDEYLYTKGALGFAGGRLTGNVFGVPESVHAPLYSWLLAPIYGLFDSQHAFKIAHGVDALLFAAVIVPVYLTARYLGARPLMSLVAGLLATWVPWAVATLVLMSESLAYFCFAWAVYAMVRAIAEPSPRWDALALLAIGATAYTRPQFALLFGVFVLAVPLVELHLDEQGRPWRERLRPHWLLGAAVLVGLIAVLVAGSSLLGGYSDTAGKPRFPPGLWQNMLSHAAHIVVGVGVIPAVAWLGWVLHVAARAPTRRELAFAVLSALIVVFVFYEVGFFSQNNVGGRIQERTAFYPAALFAVGVAALSGNTRSRGPRLSMIGAGAGVALVVGAAAFDPGEASGTFESIANAGASYNGSLQGVVADLSKLVPGKPLATAEGLALIAIALALVLAAAAQPRFRRVGVPVLAVLALLFGVRETTTVVARAVPGLNSAIPSALGVASPPRGWIDAAVQGSGDAGALESPIFTADSPTVWLWVEFWNKSVNRLYTLPGQSPYSDLPSLPFEVDEQTGLVKTPIQKPYLVVSANDPRLRVQGQVARKGAWGIDLLEPARPYRAAWSFLGAVAKPELAGMVAAGPGKPIALAVFRPADAGADQSASLDVRVTVARARKSPGATVVVRGGKRPVRVPLTGAVDDARVSVRVTVPAGEPRALLTFDAGAAKPGAIAVRDVAVRPAD